MQISYCKQQTLWGSGRSQHTVNSYKVYISHSLHVHYMSHSAYHSVEERMEGILEHCSLHRLVQHNVVHSGSNLYMEDGRLRHVITQLASYPGHAAWVRG